VAPFSFWIGIFLWKAKVDISLSSIQLTLLLDIVEVEICEEDSTILLHPEAIVFYDFPREHNSLYIGNGGQYLTHTEISLTVSGLIQR
jgi:hypothetical protein